MGESDTRILLKESELRKELVILLPAIRRQDGI